MSLVLPHQNLGYRLNGSNHMEVPTDECVGRGEQKVARIIYIVYNGKHNHNLWEGNTDV